MDNKQNNGHTLSQEDRSKGGQQNKGGQGNFAQDRERASQEGRKGGEKSRRS